tara:strand:+ start:11861 stop:12682 length:822 start_codon:yes stop_codon:yes gene_type:complete
MDMPIHDILAAAVLRILRPLARVLLSHGMAYGTFAELARRAFADEGFVLAARGGKRATVSSVSALTGMTRKEISRLRESDVPVSAGASQRYNRAIRVISGWINDADFHDASGQPAALPLEGAEASFAELTRRYSGDVPAAAMLAILEASANVRVQDGMALLVERAYIPMATSTEKINILGRDVGELVYTIGHNLEAPPADRYFQRKVSNASIGASAAEEFRALSNRKSQELLEEYNAWLNQHQEDDTTVGAESPRYVAVGIYYIDLPEQEQLP